MEAISIILWIILLAFGILQIILFFKIWGMTDNVKQILILISERIPERKMKQLPLSPTPDATPETESPWRIGCHVVRLATEEQMTIISLNSNGTFLCEKAGGLIAGSFRRDELMSWNEYLAKTKK